MSEVQQKGEKREREEPPKSKPKKLKQKDIIKRNYKGFIDTFQSAPTYVVTYEMLKYIKENPFGGVFMAIIRDRDGTEKSQSISTEWVEKIPIIDLEQDGSVIEVKNGFSTFSFKNEGGLIKIHNGEAKRYTATFGSESFQSVALKFDELHFTVSHSTFSGGKTKRKSRRNRKTRRK
jgi:hypothetical protein